MSAKRKRKAEAVAPLDLASARGRRDVAARWHLNRFRERFPTLRHDSVFAAVWREIDRLFAMKN